MSIAGTCAAYEPDPSTPSLYCSKFINYPVFLPQNYTVSEIEGVMKSSGLDLLLSLNNTPSYQQ
ncbi:hypothetical protein HDU98_009478, partial [Podochytrium sp. JEL0797]